MDEGLFPNQSPNKRLDSMATNQKNSGPYLINDVSQRVSLSQKRIREYEKEGLIKPDRESRTNNRRYSEVDIQQIRRIKTLIHKHGFTLAGLKYVLTAAPCWTIFDCQEKESCPVYNTPRPHAPCYELLKTAGSSTILKDCARCPVYLNRKHKKIPLLKKSPAPHPL